MIRQAQISIAGPQRSGKSELARRLVVLLQPYGFRPAIVDIDDTRHAIFGDDADAPIGSSENQARMRAAYRAMFGLLAPKILSVGGSPLITATHSRIEAYENSRRGAEEYGAPFFFILLEPATFEQVIERGRMYGSRSDMKDLSDPDQRRVYEETLARFTAAYTNFNGECIRIAQSSPERMAEATLRSILAGVHVERTSSP